MTGDLWDSNKEYTRLNTSDVKDENVKVRLTTEIKKNTCTRNRGIFLESFRDHRVGESIFEKFGEIYCDTLNAKQFTLPETLEEHERYFTHVQEHIKLKKMPHTNINSAINGYFYSPEPNKPDFGFFPNMENEDFFDTKTNKRLNRSETIRKKLLQNPEAISYQSRDKLCLATATNENRTAYMPIKCDDLRGDMHIQCVFDRKINLKLHGLCSKSAVDISYTLMPPKPQPWDGDGWGEQRRYGTFLGRLF